MPRSPKDPKKSSKPEKIQMPSMTAEPVLTPFGDDVPAPIKDVPASVPQPDELGLSLEQEQQLMNSLKQEYQLALAARTTWVDRQTRWHKKRYGIRPKKTFPWPGSSNLHLPLIDKNIRKLKPSFVGSLTNVVPIASFHDPRGETMGEEPKYEQEFHWLVMCRMDSYENFCISADMVLEKGFCIAKVFYDYQTMPMTEKLKLADLPQEVTLAAQQMNSDPVYEWMSKKGIPQADQPKVGDKIMEALLAFKDEVEIQWNSVEYDAPRLIIRDPKSVVVPVDTKEIEDARIIFDTYPLSGHDLKRGVLRGGFRKHVVEQLLMKNASQTATSQPTPVNGVPGAQMAEDQSVYAAAHQAKTGIDPYTGVTDIYRMIEGHTIVDVKQNGKDIRLVMLWAEDWPEEPIAVYVYDKKKAPFRKIYFDKVNLEHYDHRGVPQMLDALQTALTVQHNNEIDRQTVSTSMAFKYVPGKVNPSQIRYIPGQGIAVSDMANFDFIAPPQMDGSFENQKASLRAWAEEYIGNIDFGLAQPGTSGRDARSATEVAKISQEKQMTMSLDIKIFLNCWRKVFEMIWEEWVDHGPRDFVASMQGHPPLKVDRTGQVMGEMQITPNGSLWNSNPMLELQKAQARLQQYAGNPYIKQYQLYEDALMRDDPRLVRRLLKPEAQVQQEMQAQADQEAKMALAGGKPSKPQQTPALAT